MQKNKMMRTASGVLIATLMTSGVLFGTYAKYTTSSTGKDAARVAKWGVTALVSGDLFGSDYASASGNEISAEYKGSVDSSLKATGDRITAPGTQNSTGVTISISGTPETSNKVTFTNDNSKNQDIWLKRGTYGTMVKAEGVTADNFGKNVYYVKGSKNNYIKADSFSSEASLTYYMVRDAVTLNADYYPLVWTVTSGNGSSGESKEFLNVKSMSDNLSTNLTANHASMNPIDKSYRITWKWKFDQSNDGADTILGNIIANDEKAVAVKTSDSSATYSLLTEKTDYNKEIAFNYSIKVEQTD